MIGTEWIYWFIAALLVCFGTFAYMDESNPKRIGSGSFWTLLGVAFAYSSFVESKAAPAWVLGVIVLILTALVGTKQLAAGTASAPTQEEQVAGADKYGSRLFLPALMIPVVAIIFAVGIVHISIGGKPLLQDGSQTLIGLTVGSILAAVLAMVIFRRRNPILPVREGSRLAEAIGWAVFLPQLLAMLGTLFTTAGVGEAVGKVFGAIVPSTSLFGSVIVYCLGMFLFTIIMGNAFAAFPIMTAAIGWPLLVESFHGNAAAIFAMGMLAGFSGTLMTPMAANFNLVPAALLDTNSKYSVIKAQAPTGLILLGCTIILMRVMAF